MVCPWVVSLCNYFLLTLFPCSYMGFSHKLQSISYSSMGSAQTQFHQQIPTCSTMVFSGTRALPPPSFLTLLLLSHHPHFSLTHCLLFNIFYPFLVLSQRPHPMVGPLESAGTSLVPHGAAPASQRQFCSSGPSTVVSHSHSIYFRTFRWEFLLWKGISSANMFHMYCY